MKASRVQFARAVFAVSASAVLMAVVILGAGPLQTDGETAAMYMPPWAIEPDATARRLAEFHREEADRAWLTAWAGSAVDRQKRMGFILPAPAASEQPAVPTD